MTGNEGEVHARCMSWKAFKERPQAANGLLLEDPSDSLEDFDERLASFAWDWRLGRSVGEREKKEMGWKLVGKALIPGTMVRLLMQTAVADWTTHRLCRRLEDALSRADLETGRVPHP